MNPMLPNIYDPLLHGSLRGVSQPLIEGLEVWWNSSIGFHDSLGYVWRPITHIRPNPSYAYEGYIYVPGKSISEIRDIAHSADDYSLEFWITDLPEFPGDAIARMQALGAIDTGPGTHKPQWAIHSCAIWKKQWHQSMILEGFPGAVYRSGDYTDGHTDNLLVHEQHITLEVAIIGATQGYFTCLTPGNVQFRLARGTTPGTPSSLRIFFRGYSTHNVPIKPTIV